MLLSHGCYDPPMPCLPAFLGRCVLVSLLAAPTFPTRDVRAQTKVDLELLLAVDVSASVDEGEYRLQAQGLAAAFRDPSLREAIRRAAPNGVAVAVIQWAGGRAPVLAIDWSHLSGERSLDTLAARLEGMERLFVGSDTWLGQAVEFGVRQLLGNNFAARRQVIDLSGDGGSEAIGLTRRARDTAVAAGVTINGLAIESEDPGLFRFFQENLIGGPGAFAVRAGGYNDFADVMLRKLLREIGERPVAEVVR